MQKITSLIRKLLSTFGLEINRIAKERASFANFKNLCLSFEQIINDTRETKLKPNETRARLLGRVSGTEPGEAYHIIEALAKTENICGDVCEFGVAQGETTAVIANEIQNTDKTLHIFDSFQGLSKPTKEDILKDDIASLGSMEDYTGGMAYPEERVKGRLQAVGFSKDRQVIHKGFIEQSLQNNSNLPEKVSFAYVDFDFYEPIKTGLEFLHNVTSKGSIVIIDDYDFFSTGAKTAVDEFVQEKNSNTPIYDCIIPSTNYGHFAILTRLSD